jgi:hypothetical protein
MDQLRFGRKGSVPSTNAIKHQLGKLMADDQVKRAEARRTAESANPPQTDVGAKRRTI